MMALMSIQLLTGYAVKPLKKISDATYVIPAAAYTNAECSG